MTYSILAWDPDSGQMGVAVQSHFFGVGSVVPWAWPGVGVVATQSVVRAEYGPDLLGSLASGQSPEDALAASVADDPAASVRQVAVLCADGAGATHTGSGCIGAAGHAVGDGVRGQANLVANDRVWRDLVSTFESATGDLATRMLAALDAAEAAGGDLRGRQAAAIQIVRTTATGDLAADTVLDLRVDDDPHPLHALRTLTGRSAALAGLVRMLEAPGLLIGPAEAAADDVADALAELERAQELLGPDNTEPTVWRGLLLARNGRADAARAAFASAREATPNLAGLLRSLAAAGMWQTDVAELVALTHP